MSGRTRGRRSRTRTAGDRNRDRRAAGAVPGRWAASAVRAVASPPATELSPAASVVREFYCGAGAVCACCVCVRIGIGFGRGCRPLRGPTAVVRPCVCLCALYGGDRGLGTGARTSPVRRGHRASVVMRGSGVDGRAWPIRKPLDTSLRCIIRVRVFQKFGGAVV